MALRAVKPEIVEPEKPKFMLSGKSGVGKTLFALSFPRPYLIDTEGGATREQYTKKLTAAGGAYFGKEQGSQNFDAVIDEIKALATQKHDYKTLIVDSFSHLYNTAAAIAEEKIGNDFGRDKKEANRPTRQLMRWLETIDMTVTLICHHRDKWERRGREKLGENRLMVVKKSRIQSFPESKEIPLDFSAFHDLYGGDVIDRDSQPVSLVSPENIELIKKLLEALNIDKETIEGWFEKAKVDRWEDFTEVQGKKIIDFCNKRLASVNPPASVPTPTDGKPTRRRSAVAGGV